VLRLVRYRHYKSPDMTYKVVAIVIQEADNRPAVVYQAEYGEKITFVRPLSVWFQTVELGGAKLPASQGCEEPYNWTGRQVFHSE